MATGESLEFGRDAPAYGVSTLSYRHGKTYEDYLGLRGLERSGKKKWRRDVARIPKSLKITLEADYAVLGGGNSKNCSSR